MKCFTYKITNEINKKIYIGWTNKDPIDLRLKVHVSSARAGSNLLLHNAMRKYGYDNFNITLIDTHTSKESALTNEIELIAENCSNHCRYPGGGYNLTNGGEGTAGHKRSESSKKKVADANRGKTSKHKGKTYEEIYGDRAEGERNKRRDNHKGYVITEATREKLRKASTGNKYGCFAVEVTFSDGSVVSYASRTDAQTALKLNNMTTLRSIATGLRWRNGEHEKYNSPYDFSVKFLRTKL